MRSWVLFVGVGHMAGHEVVETSVGMNEKRLDGIVAPLGFQPREIDGRAVSAGDRYPSSAFPVQDRGRAGESERPREAKSPIRPPGTC